MTRSFSVLVLVPLAALASGCAPPGDGTYQVTGKITFNGKPVPAGKIFFLPDATKGTTGQGGYADIKDGAYDTRKKGQGTNGGNLIVRLDGFDGQASDGNPLGQALFLSYEVREEFPKSDTTRDWDVPAGAAAKRAPKGKGEPP